MAGISHHSQSESKYRKEAKTLKLSGPGREGAIPFIFFLFVFYAVVTLPSTHLLWTQIMLCNKGTEFMTEKALAPCRCAGWSEEGAQLLSFEWTMEWGEMNRQLGWGMTVIWLWREYCPFSEVRPVLVLHRPWPHISNLLCSLLVGIKIKKEVANAFVKRQKRSSLYER